MSPVALHKESIVTFPVWACDPDFGGVVIIFEASLDGITDKHFYIWEGIDRQFQGKVGVGYAQESYQCAWRRGGGRMWKTSSRSQAVTKTRESQDWSACNHVHFSTLVDFVDRIYR